MFGIQKKKNCLLQCVIFSRAVKEQNTYEQNAYIYSALEC